MISVKILKTNIYCVGWFSKISLNKVIRNKQNLKSLIDEDICWIFRGDKVSRGNEGLGERLHSDLSLTRA